jgi:uncharacterized protein (TIGR02996 family)
VTTRDDLLAVIAEDPDDDNAWLAYADWLQQRGETRGELIALDIALESATGARKTELEAARVGMLASYGAALLGETFSRFIASGYGQLSWRRGFIATFGYGGSSSGGTHLRKVGWLVKLIVDNPEPFTFVTRLAFPNTDLVNLTPFMTFKHLVELDVRTTNVKASDAALLEELRPGLRVHV